MNEAMHNDDCAKGKGLGSKQSAPIALKLMGFESC